MTAKPKKKTSPKTTKRGTRNKGKTKTNGWGGSRPGAGRKKGSGRGPSPDARVSRLSIMLTASEKEKLARLAEKQGQPMATLAHEFVSAALRRAR